MAHPSAGCTDMGGTGGYTGWVTGWVYRGSTSQPSSRGAVPSTAKRAPEAQRAGVGGTGAAGALGVRWDGDGQDHPAGPVGPLRGPPCPSLAYVPPRANTARFDPKYCKVSQDGEVSPEISQKACHSPYSQKRAWKVASWNSQISSLASLLLQGINGPVLT